MRLSYWRGCKDHEVDLGAESGAELIPFEVKYRAQHTGLRDLKGLLELCATKHISRGDVVTRSLSDFGPLEGLPANGEQAPTRIMRIPAPLLCYWMGATEISSDDT